MKNEPTSREEFLLAKVAGQDVNLDTLTPAPPISLTEKLLLDVADRLDDASQGGGGDSPFLVVTLTEVELYDSYQFTATADKTAEEIITAYSNGKIPVAYIPETNNDFRDSPKVCYPTRIDADNEYIDLYFSGIGVVNGGDAPEIYSTLVYISKDTPNDYVMISYGQGATNIID